MNEVRPWRCSRGHVLGFTRQGVFGTRQLIILRQALPKWGQENGFEEIPEVDVVAVASDLVDVQCSICEDIRSWIKIKRGGRLATDGHR